MKHLKYILLVTIALASTGCHHAKVSTGLTPSTVVIDRPWASGWIYGLVPPSEVQTASECPNGVARVETRLSFVNQLVSAITFGIYTPMHIRVTCAASGSASVVLPDREVVVSGRTADDDVIAAFGRAADEAVASGNAVYVRFSDSLH